MVGDHAPNHSEKALYPVGIASGQAECCAQVLRLLVGLLQVLGGVFFFLYIDIVHTTYSE